MTPFISIIMPTYNCEKYIERSISAIYVQSFNDWELLVVDDCSTDRTPELVRKWEEKDSRISLIRKEKNSGPGDAKNIGLSKARGKYISFCDADDWIEEDALELLSDKGTVDFDVIVAGYYRDVCDEKGNLYERNLVSMSALEVIQQKNVITSIIILDQHRLFSFACNKLYKTEIVKEKNIHFSDKKFGEDFDFNITFFQFAESVKVLETGFYHYIKQNKESLTERFIPDFYEINRERFDKMCILMKEYDCFDQQLRQIVMTLYIKHMLAAIARLYDRRGALTSRYRREKTKKILSDCMSVEAARYAKGSSKAEKFYVAIFKTRLVTLNLLFGKVLWLLQTKGKKFFEKIK